MFKNKEKQYNKLKNSKMTPNILNPNSVYGELKLSDKLSDQIKNLKEEIWQKNEIIEECEYEKDLLQNENEGIRRDNFELRVSY